VRRLTLAAGAVTLSALLAEPRADEPRATVVALHGGGMSAGYFDGQAHPDISLLALGADLGYTVLAVDRPGYGESAARLPDGVSLAAQATLLSAAIRAFRSSHRTGAGVFLLAHSYGGKLALTTAAAGGCDALLGMDISGCGSQYATGLADLRLALAGSDRNLNWGPLRLYPPGTFRASTAVVAPLPPAERDEAARWPLTYPAVAARVAVPVRFTFAEHEAWWRHDDAALAALCGPVAARCVRVDRQHGAGHNISLGWTARSYHLRAFAFFEECLRYQAL
jgi:pimeloyl-ACP methyl ester carboxylesterase